jgi:hypothetical protein
MQKKTEESKHAAGPHRVRQPATICDSLPGYQEIVGGRALPDVPVSGQMFQIAGRLRISFYEVVFLTRRGGRVRKEFVGGFGALCDEFNALPEAERTLRDSHAPRLVAKPDYTCEIDSKLWGLSSIDWPITPEAAESVIVDVVGPVTSSTSGQPQVA